MHIKCDNKVNFFLFFFLLFSLFIFGQKKVSVGNECTSTQKSLKDHPDYIKNLFAAKENIRKAKNNKERAIAYFQMGDANHKMMRYFDAIKCFQKANDYASKSNSLETIFITNLFLSNTYSHMGLLKQAQNHLEIASKISEKINNPENQYFIYNLKSNMLERENRYCEAIKYKTKTFEYNKNLFIKDNVDRNKYDYHASCAVLIYYHLKCGNLVLAKKYINELENNFDATKDSEESYLIEFYYMSKGIISSLEDNDDEAEMWFEKAITLTKRKNSKGSLAKIIEEKLFYNIGKNQSKKKHLEEYLQLYNKKNKEAQLAYESEFRKQENRINCKKQNVKILTFFSIALLSLIIFLIYYNSIRKKELKSRFEAIIKNLEQQNSNFVKNTTEEQIPTIDIDKPIKQKVISDNKEKELLEKLTQFEEGTTFTAKNFTTSNLASILDTNTKYTLYILKTHRHKNFNEYINGLKINFVISKLYQNPEYLNYKINYLSDLAGFSSHSRFTHIFKKEINISPSEFITRLQQRNKNK